MRVIVFGNAGSGKTTMARELAARAGAPVLSLDGIAFDGGPKRRLLADSLADLAAFIAEHEHWVIEGCYADLVEAALAHCTELRFLNPGVAACIAHCERRPWEPDKFASPAEQHAQLNGLLDWVRRYDTREDEYGLAAHRRVFDGFGGTKREYTSPGAYAPGNESESDNP